MTPRLLSVQEAAIYCGVSVNQFRDHVTPLVRPVTIGRRILYDVKALDDWIDRQSGRLPQLRSDDDWLKALDHDRPSKRKLRKAQEGA